METKVVINISMTIPILHNEEAVASFVEGLAQDRITDILDCPVNKIDITNIKAITKGLIKG